MRHIKLTLEYDGTNYAGWQSQTNAVAIQDVISKAIEKMAEHAIALRGASRTDAGVHALGQVATFQTSRDILCEGFLKGLNSLLPPDIRVIACEEVSKDFHPIKDAKAKHYQYILESGSVPSALWRNRVWWVGGRLDVEAMKKASRCLIGEHDFKSFQGALSDVKSTTRRITSIHLEPSDFHSDFHSDFQTEQDEHSDFQTEQDEHQTDEAEFQTDEAEFQTDEAEFQTDELELSIISTSYLPRSLLRLTFVGDGFLKYMVRNMVGTLVEIGQGRRSAEDMERILKAGDRKLAGPTAPPQGLYLLKIDY